MAIAAEEVDAKMVEVLPVVDEGVLPVGAPMAATPATSIAQFLRCNPRLGTMKGKRDGLGLEKRPALSTRGRGLGLGSGSGLRLGLGLLVSTRGPRAAAATGRD